MAFKLKPKRGKKRTFGPRAAPPSSFEFYKTTCRLPVPTDNLKTSHMWSPRSYFPKIWCFLKIFLFPRILMCTTVDLLDSFNWCGKTRRDAGPPAVACQREKVGIPKSLGASARFASGYEANFRKIRLIFRGRILQDILFAYSLSPTAAQWFVASLSSQ